MFKLRIESPDSFAIEYAANVLKKEGLVAFPTETVYGLGGIVWSERATRRIFEVKGRPSDNPLIVHISSMEMLERVASRIPEEAYMLIKKTWPGPLTLILHKSSEIPRIVTGGLETVAVRMPSHPVALELINQTNEPVAAPSANLSGRPSPTSGRHVVNDLLGRIEVILDAGETLYGIESTVVNILTDPPVLLRPGAVPVEEIEKILGRRIVVPGFARGVEAVEKALSPGMKYRHYAPAAKVVLIEASSYERTCLSKLADIVRVFIASKTLEKPCVAIPVDSLENYERISVKIFTMGDRNNIYEVAKSLFSVLRAADEEKCNLLIVEGIPEEGLGLAVMNRLRKAASERFIVEC
ncbi:MAG: L-threonylcarbamoyladenylate synthase [Thermosphaera sp.]